MKETEKFIVINKKRIKELNKHSLKIVHPINKKLLEVLKEWEKTYNIDLNNNKLKNKYYVVNKDEPYADKVWELIKDTEKFKSLKKGEFVYELDLSEPISKSFFKHEIVSVDIKNKCVNTLDYSQNKKYTTLYDFYTKEELISK